jgi:hypothetical protein
MFVCRRETWFEMPDKEMENDASLLLCVVWEENLMVRASLSMTNPITIPQRDSCFFGLPKQLSIQYWNLGVHPRTHCSLCAEERKSLRDGHEPVSYCVLRHEAGIGSEGNQKHCLEKQCNCLGRDMMGPLRGRSVVGRRGESKGVGDVIAEQHLCPKSSAAPCFLRRTGPSSYGAPVWSGNCCVKWRHSWPRLHLSSSATCTVARTKTEKTRKTMQPENKINLMRGCFPFFAYSWERKSYRKRGKQGDNGVFPSGRDRIALFIRVWEVWEGKSLLFFFFPELWTWPVSWHIRVISTALLSLSFGCQTTTHPPGLSPKRLRLEVLIVFLAKQMRWQWKQSVSIKNLLIASYIFLGNVGTRT